MVATDSQSNNFFISLLSGAIAGATVDISLFPLDTIKTRLLVVLLCQCNQNIFVKPVSC
jgi:hypothetical protein